MDMRLELRMSGVSTAVVPKLAGVSHSGAGKQKFVQIKIVNMSMRCLKIRQSEHNCRWYSPVKLTQAHW